MDFKKIEGSLHFGINEIASCDKWLYQCSDFGDFYDLNMMAQIGEKLKGSEILFISYPEGNVYKPFEIEEGIYYSKPACINEEIYFLKCDFNTRLVSILKFLENNPPQEIFSISIDEIDLYNLGLNGSPLMLTSSGQSFEVSYPEKISIKQEANESFNLRVDHVFYFTAWFEEGTAPNGIIGENYKYYEKTIGKDKDSNIVFEENGNLEKMPNGEIWLV